jgi:hypothetical protein
MSMSKFRRSDPRVRTVGVLWFSRCWRIRSLAALLTVTMLLSATFFLWAKAVQAQTPLETSLDRFTVNMDARQYGW